MTATNRVLSTLAPMLHALDVHVDRWSRTYEYSRARLLSDLRVATVLDIGANEGQYARRLRSLGYSGRIISVEPLGEPYVRLSGASSRDPDWDVVNKENVRGRMNVSGNLVSSSLLEMLEVHELAEPESRYVGVEAVRVRTLDSLVSELHLGSGPVGLKVDTQGSEEDVLSGGRDLLPRIAFVEIEMSTVALYAGQPLMPEMLASMRDRGLRLVNVRPGFVDRRSGHALQFDGMFVRVEGSLA
jgi:FkbM family methyltransferase